MLSVKISFIKSFGFGLLISNIIVFFLFWLKEPINYLFSGLLILGFLYVIKNLNINDDSKVLNIRINHLIFLIIISIVWVVLSGLVS